VNENDGRAEGTFQIVNERGLHARAAIKLVQTAQRYPCDVTLLREDQRANGKSVMGVILLCSPKGAWLTVTAEGDRAREAVDAIGSVIADRFGEGE
jgi:phosphocarrier protein